jgi:hypothetical protein
MTQRSLRDPPFLHLGVKAVFDAYPIRLRPRLLRLRQLILDTAAETEGVGEIIETLKWSQPAYLTEKPRSGSTIRIDALKGRADGYAMFFHCQTSLVATFRELYPDSFAFQGNRALVFSLAEEVPGAALGHCIALALTYHVRPRLF